LIVPVFLPTDIYTGVEELIGRFLRSLPTDLKSRIHIHTKFVPDERVLQGLDLAHVRAVVLRSLNRLGVRRLDLVQFHW